MIISSEIKQRYEFIFPYVEQVSKRVRESLVKYCESKYFAFVPRLKQVESIAEKIESGRFQKWSEIDDIFACSVIIPSQLEEEEVLINLKSIFKEVITKKRGITKNPPDLFRFTSTRFIAKLIGPEGMDSPIYEIPFEVQIRTAFEHAWVTATHQLVYKSDDIDWKKIRLSAQLKASIEQLDQLIIAFNESSQNILEHPWDETTIKKRIIEYFKEEFDMNTIPSELKPSNWSRFSDNVYNLIYKTTRYKRNLEQKTDKILKALESETQKYDCQSFPKSISLFQFVLGTLAEKKFISFPIYGYTPIITKELEIVFPSVRKIKQRFEFEE